MIRDVQLDIYRALSIMLVVGICHVCYWLQLGCEPYISMILVEMPIVFFISGASLSVNERKRSLLDVIKNRIKRVVLPFYIYAFIMIVSFALISAVITFIIENINMFAEYKTINIFSFDIKAYDLNNVIDILLCYDIPQFPMAWHLWFIAPYFVLAILFEPQKYVVNKLGSVGALVYSIIIYLFIYVYIPDTIFHTMAAYNVFMILGYKFYKRVSRKMMMIGFVLFAGITVLLMFVGYDFCPMQANKFPPNPLFVSYNICTLCLFSLFFSKIKLKTSKLFDVFNERGYTIYLYQNIVFLFVLKFRLILQLVNITFINFVINSIIVLLISYYLSFITYWIECRSIRLIRFLNK